MKGKVIKMLTEPVSFVKHLPLLIMILQKNSHTFVLSIFTDKPNSQRNEAFSLRSQNRKVRVGSRTKLSDPKGIRF